MTGNSTDGMDWYAQEGEVLRRKRDGELFHVTSRLEDIDNGDRRYEMWDDTHTTKDVWYVEDVRNGFEKTDVVVLHGHKPLQRLDGRLYDNTTDSDIDQ
jgi:hypothetical protein